MTDIDNLREDDLILSDAVLEEWRKWCAFMPIEKEGRSVDGNVVHRALATIATLTAERDKRQREVNDAEALLAERWRENADLVKEVDALRTALERIAFEDDLVYLGCSDIPHCSGASREKHADDCVIGVAREALGGKS